jgi:hypothetical protein
LNSDRDLSSRSGVYAARPLLQNNFRPDFGKPLPFGGPAIEAVTVKITEAFDGLEDIAGGPVAFVKSMLRTLMPRPETASGLFSGSSNRHFMGRANLFNPDLEYIDEKNIANSLVHEAIHTFLYLTELSALPVQDTNILYYDFVESPWSGKSIHLLAYIHASFVWYGLHHFWALPDVERRFSGAVRDHYLEFTRKGFRQGRMLGRLKRFEPHIRPELMEQLIRLQATMLSV